MGKEIMMEGVMMAAESAAQTVDNAAAGAEVVASPEGSASENNAAVQEIPESGERSPVQDRNTNAYYKGLRQKAEQQAREQEQQAATADFESRVRESDLYRDLEARASQDRADAELHRVSERMRADLEAIRELDPSVHSLDELGSEFKKLVRTLDGPTAFLVMKGREAVEKAAMPPATGAVGGCSNNDRDLTSEELDQLKRGDLIENDSLYQRAMRSIRRLKE